MQIVSIYLHIKAWLTVFYFWCRLLPNPKLNKLVCLALSFFFLFLGSFLELLCISEAPIGCVCGWIKCKEGKFSGRICGAGGKRNAGRRGGDGCGRGAGTDLPSMLLLCLTDCIKKSENIDYKKCFWPTRLWISHFMNRFNIKYKSNSKTFYSKEGLLCQLVPSLHQCFALKEIFKVPGGDGRILNIDESMTYHCDQWSKSWCI